MSRLLKNIKEISHVDICVQGTSGRGDCKIAKILGQTHAWGYSKKKETHVTVKSERRKAVRNEV